MKWLAAAAFALAALVATVGQAQTPPPPTRPAVVTNYNSFQVPLGVPTAGPFIAVPTTSTPTCLATMYQPFSNTAFTPQGSDDTYVWHALPAIGRGSITMPGTYLGPNQYRFFRLYFTQSSSPGATGFMACGDNPTSLLAPMLNGIDGVLNTYQQLSAIGHPGCATFDANGNLLPQGGGLPCAGGGGSSCPPPNCLIIQTPSPSPSPGVTVPPQSPGPNNITSVAGEMQSWSWLTDVVQYGSGGSSDTNSFDARGCSVRDDDASSNDLCFYSYAPTNTKPLAVSFSFGESPFCEVTDNWCWSSVHVGSYHSSITLNSAGNQGTPTNNSGTYLDANSDGNTHGNCESPFTDTPPSVFNDTLGVVTKPYFTICSDLTPQDGTQRSTPHVVLMALGSTSATPGPQNVGTMALLNTVQLTGVDANSLLCTDANSLVKGCGATQGLSRLTQTTANSYATSCTMTSTTSCVPPTSSVVYTSLPLCFVTSQGTAAIAGSCQLSWTAGNPAGIVVWAASANTLTWDVLIVGNPF